MRLPLIGGSYVARSRIANSQRCVNYFPEINRQDSPVPFTFYQRPGLRYLTHGPGLLAVRMLYRATNGIGFCVIGAILYKIERDFGLTTLGQLNPQFTGPCRAIDNGQTLVVVDGSQHGWQVDLTSYAFSQIVDGTGSFLGANTLGYIDTYILWNMPNSLNFGSTLSNSVTFDALYFAGKVGYPDLLVALQVNRHEILLFGTLKSEIWYNAGNATFPFAQLPGAYIEHGCVAPFSVQSVDIQTFWLGQDLEGRGVILSLKGYDVKRISNHALEYAIQNMSEIGDAFAYTYQQDGHYFYVITFPSADQTWVYDVSMEGTPDMAWHQRGWIDSNGTLHRERANCCAFINNVLVVGDWENGQLYKMDPTYYYDDVGGPLGTSTSIPCIKGFPHNLQAAALAAPPGTVLPSELKRIRYDRFYLDIETGEHPLDANGDKQQITLSVSLDRGQSFTDYPMQPTGAPGEYAVYPSWHQLGTQRDVVFQISHSIPGPAALNGAYVECTLLES